MAKGACQLCKRDEHVDFVWATVLKEWGSTKKDLACWHVCHDCRPHFEETVLAFYRDL